MAVQDLGTKQLTTRSRSIKRTDSEGNDPLLPLLATYLGHVHVHETYWYLEAVPELLALATERLVDGRQEVTP